MVQPQNSATKVDTVLTVTEGQPPVSLKSPTVEPDRIEQAAQTMYEALTNQGYSLAEKLDVRKKLDQYIRLEIDENIKSLQALRASF